jgi:hypothetical protein
MRPPGHATALGTPFYLCISLKALCPNSQPKVLSSCLGCRLSLLSSHLLFDDILFHLPDEHTLTLPPQRPTRTAYPQYSRPLTNSSRAPPSISKTFQNPPNLLLLLPITTPHIPTVHHLPSLEPRFPHNLLTPHILWINLRHQLPLYPLLPFPYFQSSQA